MPFDLSRKQSDAWHFLEDKETTEILYGGGAGGGKSWLGCLWHIIRRIKYPGSRGLIGRAKISTLEQSTLVTLFEVAAKMGYVSGRDFNYSSTKHIITWANGSKTILKDLFFYPADPDFTSLGSTEYTDAFIDEATEITLKAFEIVNSRIRWKLDEYGIIPKILLTCNPGPGWVKDKFIVNKNKAIELKPYQRFVKALITDNPREDFKALYMEQLSRMTSDYDKARLIHGDWEAAREVLNPFFNEYDPVKHESVDALIQPGKPVIISIDFNLNPFAVNFYQMWQDAAGFHSWQIDEASIAHGSIPAMIDLINTRFYSYLPSCKVTGDYNGRKGELSQRDNASNYEQIRRGLKLRENQIITPTNPTHENSRSDCNYFLHHFPDFKINPLKCPDTCRDMRMVQCDNFGSIIKKSRNDISQQADHADATRYKINTFAMEWITRHQKGWYGKK